MNSAREANALAALAGRAVHGARPCVGSSRRRRVSMHWHRSDQNGRRVYEVWDLVSGQRVLRTYSWREADGKKNRMLAEYARLDEYTRKNDGSEGLT